MSLQRILNYGQRIRSGVEGVVESGVQRLRSRGQGIRSRVQGIRSRVQEYVGMIMPTRGVQEAAGSSSVVGVTTAGVDAVSAAVTLIGVSVTTAAVSDIASTIATAVGANVVTSSITAVSAVLTSAFGGIYILCNTTNNANVAQETIVSQGSRTELTTTQVEVRENFPALESIRQSESESESAVGSIITQATATAYSVKGNAKKGGKKV